MLEPFEVAVVELEFESDLFEFVALELLALLLDLLELFDAVPEVLLLVVLLEELELLWELELLLEFPERFKVGSQTTAGPADFSAGVSDDSQFLPVA